MGDSNVALALGWEERSSIALMPKSGTDCYALGIPNQTPRNAATPIEVIENDLRGPLVSFQG